MRDFFKQGFVVYERYMTFGDPVGVGSSINRQDTDVYDLINTSTIGNTVLRTYEYRGPRQALIRANDPAQALEIAGNLDYYERELGPAFVVRYDKKGA